jgi:uncharacterized membrane protein
MAANSRAALPRPGAQNRMLGQAERRDDLGLQVTMLTEQELTIVLRMLRQLCERGGIGVGNHP